jgi:Raf kinase inhibitor-like YbhB/YbcL family protein
MKDSTNFTLKSRELGGQLNNQNYSNSQGFTGANQSPQLYWENIPVEAKCLAVTMYDLDAPTGSGFWHWVVFNIPAEVQELLADAGNPSKSLLPESAVQSNTDTGMPGYSGAAPTPDAAHRYIITVHALSKKLDLNENTTPAIVGGNINANSVGKASILVYGQK